MTLGSSGAQSSVTSRPSKGPERDRLGVADADDLAHVLGLAAVELLAVGVAHLWVGLHDDARQGAVDPGLPRPGRGRLAVLEGLDVLTQVPHVAAAVLGEPVGGLLDSSPSRVSVSVTTVAVIPMTSRVWHCLDPGRLPVSHGGGRCRDRRAPLGWARQS
jgi:hypothetical protein